METTFGRRAVVAGALLYLTVQILLPIGGIREGGVDRWSWEMFSRTPSAGKLRVVHRDSVTYTTVGLVLGINRYEIQDDPDREAIVCSFFPDAVAVVGPEGRVACER